MIFFFDTLMADLFLVLVARLIASSFLVAACCAFLFIVFLIGIFPELTAVDAAAFFVISFFSSFFSAFFTTLSACLLLAFATAFATFFGARSCFFFTLSNHRLANKQLARGRVVQPHGVASIRVLSE